MTRLMCPSIMCSNFSNLEREITELDEAGTDIFHLDVMDGCFVPNFGMGLQDIELVRKTTSKLIDVHLMIMEPSKHIRLFSELGVDIIYIHPEADLHPTRTLKLIKDLGKNPGIAINPGTSVESVRPLFNLIDYLIVMTVNPGFAGQKYLDFVDDKIIEVIQLSKMYNFKVLVDGAISPIKVFSLSEKGVNGFVLGTSALFGKEDSYINIINYLKRNTGKEVKYDEY